MLALVKTLVLPPGNLLLLGFLGLLVHKRRPRLGYGCILAAFGLLYLLSTPLVAAYSLSLLEGSYADPLQRPEGQAIVALGGGTFGHAVEYGTDVPNEFTVARARYAAKLHRESGKPLLVSGGSTRENVLPEAQQMKFLLEEEMNVPVRWTEERSVDTYTNALESYRVLAPLGIKTVYLVTHAWHIPRARLAFEHAGFEVIPAPTAFSRGDDTNDDLTVTDFLPSARALLKSYYFWHEVAGYLAYSVRVGLDSRREPS